MKLAPILVVCLALAAAYSLLTAGSPDSLLRHVIENPKHDVWAAFAFSFMVFALGFWAFFSKEKERFEEMVKTNRDRILSLRQAGKTDDEIADSILDAMGAPPGQGRRAARKKLVFHMSKM
ncbi:conserved hypothetical protein [Candidatus Desulfarcum epimagneticum]|uniref:Uncharacterized protein n=1 Tax=uncultured Desulfobacteraceae bacterium TaxID=218296 RepID=A0A484HFL3_9BACT|nr:conserved hypothetical protein [uncultured Desulfobacteraceae bacterium]